jgi:hypothetical protein
VEPPIGVERAVPTLRKVLADRETPSFDQHVAALQGIVAKTSASVLRST